MFLGCATLILKRGFLNIKQVPFSTQFVCLCIDVVEGAIFFKLLEKTQAFFGKFQNMFFFKTIVLCFLGHVVFSWFTFESFCFSKLLFKYNERLSGCDFFLSNQRASTGNKEDKTLKTMLNAS